MKLSRRLLTIGLAAFPLLAAAFLRGAWMFPLLAVGFFFLPRALSLFVRRPGRELSAGVRRALEAGSIGAALLGIVLMAQPFAHLLFRVGFFALLCGGIAYISATFWPPRGLTLWGAARLLYWTVYTLAAALWLSGAAAPALLRL